MRELVFPGPKRALQRIQEMDQRPYLTREEKLEYDELLKFYRDCVNIIDYAYEQGRKKGFALTLKERGGYLLKKSQQLRAFPKKRLIACKSFL